MKLCLIRCGTCMIVIVLGRMCVLFKLFRWLIFYGFVVVCFLTFVFVDLLCRACVLLVCVAFVVFGGVCVCCDCVWVCLSFVVLRLICLCWVCSAYYLSALCYFGVYIVSVNLCLWLVVL